MTHSRYLEKHEEHALVEIIEKKDKGKKVIHIAIY